jgi:GH15 family glucan-1,4-alpha-glucosidase
VRIEDYGLVGVMESPALLRLAGVADWLCLPRFDLPAVATELGRDGFVSRYSTADAHDGSSGDEGPFLACSCWLVSALAFDNRGDGARALFERLLGRSDDVGPLAEEIDVGTERQVGNFPRAFSHPTPIGAVAAIAWADKKRVSA